MNAGEFRVIGNTVVRIRESNDPCPELWMESSNGAMGGCYRDDNHCLATKQEIAKWYRERYKREFKMFMKQLKRTENALQNWKNATEEAKLQ
jgi:hypothetical protein